MSYSSIKKKIIRRPFYKGLNKEKPLKSETYGLSKKGGRNNQGCITIKGRGFGHKRSFRIIRFNRYKEVFGKGLVCNISYDPNRTAYILLVQLDSGKYIYLLAPSGIKCGQIIETGFFTDILVGNSLPLGNIPLGSLIHNISNFSEKNGIFSRSAGTFSQLIKKNAYFGQVRLSSGEHRLISLNTFVTLGMVSNLNNNLILKEKAGRRNWLGFKSKVRGVAMNPIDHPHGGGEGKTSGGRPSVTFKGLPTRGRRTSKLRNTKLIVQSRRFKR